VRTGTEAVVPAVGKTTVGLGRRAGGGANPEGKLVGTVGCPVLSKLDASGAESGVNAVLSAGAEDKLVAVLAEAESPCVGVARKPCWKPVASRYTPTICPGSLMPSA